MANQMDYEGRAITRALQLDAKELVDSGEIITAGDVPKYFAPFEIAAIFDFLIDVLKIELKI